MAFQGHSSLLITEKKYTFCLSLIFFFFFTVIDHWHLSKTLLHKSFSKSLIKKKRVSPNQPPFWIVNHPEFPTVDVT